MAREGLLFICRSLSAVAAAAYCCFLADNCPLSVSLEGPDQEGPDFVAVCLVGWN
jgi:hypothetical protein